MARALAMDFDDFARLKLQLTVTIATINAWNRIAGLPGFTPPPAEARTGQ